MEWIDICTVMFALQFGLLGISFEGMIRDSRIPLGLLSNDPDSKRGRERTRKG